MGSACAALLDHLGVAGEPLTVSSSVLSCVSNRSFDSQTSQQNHVLDYRAMAPNRRHGGRSGRRRRSRGRSRSRSRSRSGHRRHRHRRPRCSSLLSVASSVYNKRRIYKKIKSGMRKSVPAAIVLYPFHKIRSAKNGLTSRRVINFLRKHYGLQGRPAGKSISSMLRCAVDFGLLAKRGNRFFLPKQSKLPWKM